MPEKGAGRASERDLERVLRHAREPFVSSVDTVGEVADGVRNSIGYDHHAPPTRASSAICASVFATVAYRHPYFDGNKRSAFLAAILVGRSLGFGIRETPYAEIESEVRDLTAREAGLQEVSEWLRRKVFIMSGEEEV